MSNIILPPLTQQKVYVPKPQLYPNTIIIPPGLPQDQERVRRRILKYQTDPKFFFENELYIIDNEANRILLTLNETQILILNAMVEQAKKGLPIRVLVLKARQEGVSTLCLAILFHRTALFRFIRSMILADNPEQTTELFKIVKMYYEDMRPEFQPMKRVDNIQALTFENPQERARYKDPGLRSSIITGTAGRTKVGRSLRLHAIHMTEMGLWTNPNEIMTSVLSCIHDHPGTIVMMESTGKGKGTQFEVEWYKAVNQQSKYKAIFIPWFMKSESKISLSPMEEREIRNTLTPDELDLITHVKDKYPQELTYGQISWRRDVLHNKCASDVYSLMSEYPSTPEEAFSAQSNLVYPFHMTDYLKNVTEEPLIRGNLSYEGGYIQFTEPTEKPLWIWKWPKPGEKYIMGVDPGGDENEEDSRSNHSSFVVVNARTLEQVAEFDADIDLDDFKRIVFWTATYYNKAKINIEINNVGYAVLAYLKDNYRNISQWERGELGSPGKTSWRLGFYTDVRSKKLKKEALSTLLSQKVILMRSGRFKAQIMNYIADKKGKTRPRNAAGVNKDDISRFDDLISATELVAVEYMRDRTYREGAQNPTIEGALSPTTGVSYNEDPDYADIWSSGSKEMEL